MIEIKDVIQKRKFDLLIGLICFLPVWIAVFLKGDILLFGYRYYIFVPFAFILFTYLAKLPPFFIAGVSAVISGTFLYYFYEQLFVRLEGLRGLLYICSLPGAVAGTIIATIILHKKYKIFGVSSAGLIGSGCTALGFLIGQKVIFLFI